MAHPKSFTDAEKAFVLKHWPTETTDWIGEQLGRGATSVRRHAQRLGLPPKPSVRAGMKASNGTELWTEDDDNALRRLWNIITAREIGEKLGRSRNAVIGRAHRLGLNVPSAPAVRLPARPEGPVSKTCQWPIGDPASPKFRFCGEAVAADKPQRPYCPTHCAVAYRSASKTETMEIVAVKKRLKKVA